MATKRKKVAILGGGMSALTTAYELTSQPGWRDRFEKITVYQHGWRLGGKGASGRWGPYGVIQEHGLHVWLGFYDNAFSVIKEVYGQLKRPPGAPLSTWDEAFKPHSYVVIMESVAGSWSPWVFDLPTNREVPGEGPPPSLHEALAELTRWLRDHVGGAKPPPARAPVAPPPVLGRVERRLSTSHLPARLPHLPARLTATAHALAEQLCHRPTERTEGAHFELVELLEEAASHFHQMVDGELNRHPGLRRTLILLELGATCIRGLYSEGILTRGESLDKLDAYDLREWLLHHGAPGMAIHSAPLKGLYDLVFGYLDGRTDRPVFAAGAAVRAVLRMCFTYRGAVFWKMQAGMGDVVFAPLYQVLRERGVEFNFFHRVLDLGLSPDQRSVDSIRVERQATLAEGVAEYDPLVDVRGLPCWPAEPRFEQLAEGEELRTRGVDLESFWTPWKGTERTLRRGVDFDEVVLGISLGALPFITKELTTAGLTFERAEAARRWRLMLNMVKTVRTQAAQLWIGPDLAGTGWTGQSPVLDGYVNPLNTWADMSHLIPREAWPAGSGPGSIAYFCGPAEGGIPPREDVEAPERELRATRDAAVQWLDANTGQLWPRMMASGGAELDRSRLLDPSGQGTGDAMRAQFFRVNLDPSERYVISAPGSTRFRLDAHEAGFANLWLAGDWTRNGINAGCIEAAVISGMRAARALEGQPPRERVRGDLPTHAEPSVRDLPPPLP